MKILITGIGNIGKSSLREMVAHKFVRQVIDIDMDYYTCADIPKSSNKVVLIEDVHGLERHSDQYDKIIYLMPPQNHIMLWLKRAWAWFSSGIVDRSDPKGICKPYAFYNIPIILKIVLKNILLRKKWVSDDIQIIKKEFEDKTVIVKSIDVGYKEIEKSFY
ncbi:MAG: hypothetical protein JRC89_06130 [Deltaproteobacteria bacterium]|nr:hypothetical protein [Deltaproteobacteria bacterium]